MKKGFSKLLLAIVMTLQLVPSSMTTIVANDNVAYTDDFVQITMENKPFEAYETGAGEISEGVSKLHVTVNVDGALKTSKILMFNSATNPAETEIKANEGYAIEQITLDGEDFKNSIVYNDEVGESEKTLVINVYTKANVLNQNQELMVNKLVADDEKDKKTKSTTTYTKKAEFFVLLPSSELPKNLAGNYNPKNFVPSNSNPWYGPNWVGNNITHNQGAGFSGFISDEAYQKAYVNKKPITNENGVDTEYIYMPDGHIPLKYIIKNGADKGKEIELSNIVWYSIKKQDSGKPHVDGYIKAVDVEIGYFANIDGFDTPVIDKAVTGDEYTVKDYSSLKEFPQRKGYIFTGWNTKADGSGTNYTANAKFTVKTSVALYAQWKKTDQKYTIQHYDEDSNEKIHDDEYKNAKFGDIIDGSTCQLSIRNFTFTKANTITVDTNDEKNIIKVYYSRDESSDKIPDKYQIEVTYTAENGTIGSSHANGKKIYVTLFKDGKWATKEDGGFGHLNDDQIATATAAKGYSQSSLSWTPETPTTSLALNTDTEFVARFEEDAEITISYKSNDETMGAVDNATDEVKPSTGTVKGSKAEANEGYTFKYWTNAEGTIVSWDEEFKPVKVDGLNVAGEYTANFGTDENGDQIPDEYQVKYTYQAAADQKGTVSGTTVEWINKYKVENGKLVIENNKPVVIDAHPTQPSIVKADKGYHFQKWNDGTNDFATDEELRNAKYEEDTTFTAYFEEDAEITISYKSNDETMGAVTNAKDEVKPVTGTVKGSKAEAKEGYAFKNWTNAEGTVVRWNKEFKPAKVDGLNVVGEYTANFGKDENGDQIPDEYQAVVTFAAVNGTVSFDKTYVTLYDAQGNYAEDGTGRLAQNQIAAATPNSGYHFVSWAPETPKQDMEITNKGASFTANHAINTYAAAVRFLNEDTGEELAPAVTVNNIEHGTYLYGESHRISIPGYVFTVADTKVVESNNVIVNVYYTADIKGGLPDPDTTPDGTPDKYQVRFEYVADTNGSVTGTTVEYVTRPGNNTTAAVRPQALVDAIANDGYSFMSWTTNGNAYVNTDAMRNTYFTEDTVFTAGFAEVVSPILPTPVTPTPPAVTPPTPGTPVPAAPAAPVTPVAPVIPPVVVPVIPTPAPTPTPNPGPIVNEDDPDQPQGGESTEVQENPTPKGGGSQNEWALINLICAGGTVLLGLFLLLSKLKKEEEEEDEKTSAMRNDEEQSNGYKRRKWLRVASTITAVVSVIAFFLTEDITLAMVLVDRWTLLMAAFLIVQVIFVLFGRKWKELDDNKNNAETARS